LNESKDGEFPPVPLSLLVRLDALIPEKCPDLGMSERDIFHYAGQRSLIRTLWQIHNEQNEVK
jgi:hypothetical protein